MNIDRRYLALLLFFISVVSISFKLSTPSNVWFIVVDDKLQIKQLNGFYTFTDAVLLIFFAVILGATGVYLMMLPVEERPVHTIDLNGLKDNEKKIVEILIENDGVMFQSEIVEKSGLPKSTVSIILDKLEAKGIVERRKYGMSNVVILKKANKLTLSYTQRQQPRNQSRYPSPMHNIYNVIARLISLWRFLS